MSSFPMRVSAGRPYCTASSQSVRQRGRLEYPTSASSVSAPELSVMREKPSVRLTSETAAGAPWQCQPSHSCLRVSGSAASFKPRLERALI